jgi:isoleucyl-tRNA synthetase
MQRMQALINEGRKVRDKTKINLRTPMSKVVVVHGDAQFRSDIASLSFLVKDELNLVDVEARSLFSSFLISRV